MEPINIPKEYPEFRIQHVTLNSGTEYFVVQVYWGRGRYLSRGDQYSNIEQAKAYIDERILTKIKAVTYIKYP